MKTAMMVAMMVVATAWWTGKSEPVRTVTGRSAIRCEYRYANQTFWRTFAGSLNCPSSVEVY